MSLPLVLVLALVLLAGVLAVAFTLPRRLDRRWQRVAATEREATVRAAVDSVVTVAGDKLGDHVAAGSRELDVRTASFDRQVDVMAAEIQHVRDLLGTLERERAEQHGRLESGLAESVRASSELSGVTRQLSAALASPKARGQWGERMAEDVVQSAGLVEGVNYRRQKALDGGTIPDFTFLLPREQVLHMDVKFPVDNYLRHLDAVAADETADAERYRTAFLRDVRRRVTELTTRGYAEEASTIGYLLMFIPNESVYGFIHEHDAGLLDFALDQRVVPCSPSTLFAVLAVVRQAVDSFAFERTSGEILDCLSSFTTEWEKFSSHLDTLGGRLEKANKTFDELAGVRRRQLERRLDAVDALRAQRGAETDGDADPAWAEVTPLREATAG